MFSESIYTLEEVAEHLRVSVEVVAVEIEGGRLRALRVGKSLRIQETALNAFKNQDFSSPAGNNLVKPATIELDSTAEFTHIWPDNKKELFTDAQEGVVRHDGRDYHVKIGFTTRKVAGKLRGRSVVLVNRYPTVEFVASDEDAKKGKMASIIKNRDRKQVPARAVPPPEYAEITVGPYRDIVDGPGASNGLAVICNSDDLTTMVRHALIRYKYRQERGTTT